MTKAQFETIVNDLIAAEVNYSWKGGGDPRDIAELEKELRNARREYKAAVQQVFQATTPTSK